MLCTIFYIVIHRNNKVYVHSVCRIHVKVFVYVVVSHQAVGLLQVLVTSPCRGGAAEIYN